MSKSLEYYMGLPYRIEIIQIPENEGGGFAACLPEVGRHAIVGDGETPKEALESLEAIKHERLAEYISKGMAIPEPQPMQNEFSGQFVVRLPKYLHGELVNSARENGVSLNQYVMAALSSHVTGQHYLHVFGQLSLELRHMSDCMHTLSYKIDPNSYLPDTRVNDLATTDPDDYGNAA